MRPALSPRSLQGAGVSQVSRPSWLAASSYKYFLAKPAHPLDRPCWLSAGTLPPGHPLGTPLRPSLGPSLDPPRPAPRAWSDMAVTSTTAGSRVRGR